MNKIVPKFKAQVINGKVVMEGMTKDTFDGYLKSLDGFVEVTVKPWSEKNQRSNNQNRYYFGVIIKILSDETGYTSDEIHELLKFKFLKTSLIIKGKEYLSVKSSTELSTAEAEEYFRQARQWASIELGIYIPEPNEVSYD